LGVKANDVVLNFGCGPGFYTILFAKVAKEVIVVDIQSEMLEKVSRYAKRVSLSVQCFQSDVLGVPLSDEYCDLTFLSRVYSAERESQSVVTSLH